jgi:ferritin-like metal-binding protein YciE
MGQGKQGKQLVQQLLAEAHAAETALIQTLGAHISITPAGDYRRGLETHLRETRTHAEKVQRRLTDLGFRKNPIQLGHGIAQSLLKNTMSLAKAPVDMLRGKSLEEKLVRNARDEAVTETLEIALYDTIENVALGIGDNETAQLVREIRADEERMLDSLRQILPSLAGGLVREQIPPEERSVTSADELALNGYDDLTAEEIVGRLNGLSQEDLRAIEQYETKNANRATILRKLESLRTQEPWPGYDGLTVAEIRSELQHAPKGRLAKVREYERAHKNRTSVIDLTERETAGV